MNSGKLLFATGVSHMKQEKRIKASDDSATDENAGAFVLLGNVAWPENVENDTQQKTAVGNWRQTLEARNAKKID